MARKKAKKKDIALAMPFSILRKARKSRAFFDTSYDPQFFLRVLRLSFSSSGSRSAKIL